MLEVRHLSKTYGFRKHFYLKKEQIPIFENINFSLQLGENLLIGGESGSGKSTLGKILCMLENPSKGEVLYQGENIHTLRDKRRLRQEIQYVFQDQKTALNPYKTIKTLIEDVEKNFNLCKNGYLSLLQDFELKPHILNLKPLSLSGGEAQRVGLLRALLLKPKILICDEVTASLDFLGSYKIYEILKKYQDCHPISYIFISHNHLFHLLEISKKIML